MSNPQNETYFNHFYLRYYNGNHNQYGKEYIKFEIFDNGELKYCNQSRYRNETEIIKKLHLTRVVMKEIQDIISQSHILIQTDAHWPNNINGSRQELEIEMNDNHIFFVTSKFGTLNEIRQSKDPQGLLIFYNFINDLICLLTTLTKSHSNIHSY
ncbi:mago nashi protein [Entamoeba nuttalli P19]|uniref:Mago nashi protein n=1 Tax=Entamoeba nuttalli (strain P19) TaxID=1076696 RepID=K2GIB1_ENTNP|nr:mago nashi protein [Entamoeba nuttalli P19]EKE42506.1 mago nashi protein [Entamoeba nuttalli P19]|eukprot:XP_008855157.1 mago nashi protein [Entamoeba nuttalli P19]